MVWVAFQRSNRFELVRLERDFKVKKHGYSAGLYLALLEEYVPTIIILASLSCRIMLLSILLKRSSNTLKMIV
ncbi:hypothetical protein P175DRAFT_0541504 [Aspergillus ochraceoroseus IBT 24754]|uniref:Uncharacterized protein n=1 Tax=Aspergillus ochraceoroseus IBT 24754 TaxID=1392256 RepID=A0A2T5LL25_9EURO|nr:uncharacterized protein P175DRAFT_0541504 [Aspergillus ochraceoroseus IBT 24754]PTU16984.1 hypothetical protein P175DRAFT_0541504 [Aspergillus ochraceoroseus IBT 24754]